MAPAAHDNSKLDATHSRATIVAPGDSLTVLIDFPLSAELVARLASVDPRVAPVPLGEKGGRDSRADDPDVEAALERADVLFTFWPAATWLEKAPRLKWVQLSSAGVDHLLREGTLSKYPGLIVTTASGIHEVPISEHIVGMILYFSRGFNQAVSNQQRRKWERFTPGEALGKTVCFIGYGPIARRAAKLCSALGMRAVAVRASLSKQQPGLSSDPVERFFPLSDLHSALTESDYVVIAAPRTPRSEGMIGRDQLAAMKSSAVLINISRGALVDEPALVKALQAGKIAGAGLDVFTQEPLPANSPLWAMLNVLITPHISGANPNYHQRATELFRDNLARYLGGEPLRNVVNVERGY